MASFYADEQFPRRVVEFTGSKHKGIIVCSRDDDWRRQAERIDTAVASLDSMDSQLIRVNKPGSV